jgi:hypothetical protein
MQQTVQIKHEQAPQLIAHIATKDAQRDLCEVARVNHSLQSSGTS